MNNPFRYQQLASLPRAWVRLYAAVGQDPDYADSVRPSACESNRLTVDAIAAWHRWALRDVPDLSSASAFWLEVLCRARAETLASLDLPGMKANLALREELLPVDPIARPLYSASRQVFSGEVTEPIRVFSGSQLSGSRSISPTVKLLTRIFRSRSDEKPPTDDQVIRALQQAALHLHNDRIFFSSVKQVVTSLGEWYGPRHESLGIARKAKSAKKLVRKCPERVAQSEAENLPAEYELNTIAEPRFVSKNYKVYNDSLDEVDSAEKWLRQSDIDELDRLDVPQRRDVRRIAHQLQRRLQAASLRRWSFDQEQGFLDPRRLARLIGRTPDCRVFRTEEEALMQDACVCLLVDQSGSMRGSRQVMAALAIDFAVNTLEICGISCEVLGFTTRFGAESPMTRHWAEAGRVASPGRLNALRHIILKKGHQPWRRARKNLGLVLRSDFGKDNLDGEALIWAGRRLFSRRESNKILVVLSDGTPFDRATVGANGSEYLEDHLRQAISATEAQGVRLIAVGVGQSVAAFYRKAVAVKDPIAIPDALMKSLGAALLGTDLRKKHEAAPV